MRMNYITVRSVTPAQRGQRSLNQAGIACTLQRTPRQMQERALAHESAGTLETGTLRLSFGHDTCNSQTDAFLRIVQKML